MEPRKVKGKGGGVGEIWKPSTEALKRWRRKRRSRSRRRRRRRRRRWWWWWWWCWWTHASTLSHKCTRSLSLALSLSLSLIFSFWIWSLIFLIRREPRKEGELFWKRWNLKKWKFRIRWLENLHVGIWHSGLTCHFKWTLSNAFKGSF